MKLALEKIEYIIKKSRRRTISVQITPDQKLLVKAPTYTSIKEVEDFLHEKRDWILKQLNRTKVQSQQAAAMGILTDKEIRKLKRDAKKIIPERVEYYAKLSGITYNRIFIRLQKSRWGSCSVEGNLNFNALLALMPLEVLDSVVVHELCHRRHMDHSKDFYDEVLKIFPDYKKWDKWLKQNGAAYQMRVPD
ncbi:MAG: M48 family metallopeptidase [Treponema sp.]|uniref:M48 family metallopeptidase n=1 Tax=Treponema sp. TaxID=166 RepID=UPI00298DCC15|nr:SprT family zinc-dependent metalloprotease [Treponema sp.]MCQ2600949.1 M48 family metallopeptidase [Treponema sp.]